MEGDLRVLTPSGRPIGSLYPVKTLNFAWNRNQVDGGSFALPSMSARWSNAFIEHQNIVEFHSSELPEVWTGVIVSRRHGSLDGGVTCLSLLHLLRSRFTEEWWQFIGTSGAIAQALHGQATRNGSLHIDMGEVDRSGPEYYVEYQREEVFKALTDIAEMTGGDFWVEKIGHEHRDMPVLRWSRARGRNLTGSVVLSAEVTTEPDMEEAAPELKTAAHVYGVEVDGERLYQYVPHPVASKYGLLEARLDFPEIIDPTLLYEAGARQLEKLSSPQKLIACNIDNRRGQWGRFWLGDTVRAILYGQGFLGYDGPVRVQGIQVSGDTDEMGLVVEVPQ